MPYNEYTFIWSSANPPCLLDAFYCFLWLLTLWLCGTSSDPGLFCNNLVFAFTSSLGSIDIVSDLNPSSFFLVWIRLRTKSPLSILALTIHAACFFSEVLPTFSNSFQVDISFCSFNCNLYTEFTLDILCVSSAEWSIESSGCWCFLKKGIYGSRNVAQVIESLLSLHRATEL